MKRGICIDGQHDLIRILSHSEVCSEAVVRWCQKCGAVVVDVDYDGRTNYGQVMPMRFPKWLTTDGGQDRT